MNILNILFPKSCFVCSKQGEYVCERCRKMFKRNLPECYICRKISPNYQTHYGCKNRYSYDSVFVGWEYNDISSDILKAFKYRGAYDVESSILSLFSNILKDFEYVKKDGNSLVVPVPVSANRLRERGFNQTENLARYISNKFHFDFSEDLVINIDNSDEHQSLKDRENRRQIRNKFVVNKNYNLRKYKSIIVVDDVITTGSTIEQISKIIKEYHSDISLNALCLFRGKPRYS